MDPFRYSFETDEQYQARIEQLQAETQIASPAESTAASNRWFGLTIPWWAVVIFVVVILLLIYRESRRKLRRKLRAAAREQPRFPMQLL